MNCKHDHTTIVQDHRDDVGTFLNTQCDVCGMCLPKAPIDEATFWAWHDGKLRVPEVDRDAYKRAIDAALVALSSEAYELETFVKAARA